MKLVIPLESLDLKYCIKHYLLHKHNIVIEGEVVRGFSIINDEMHVDITALPQVPRDIKVATPRDVEPTRHSDDYHDTYTSSL